MIARSVLTAAQIEELRQSLTRRLEGIGVESQPEVALRILELARNPRAQLKEYAEVIRTDSALSGRLLKLANSAYFAQRVAVTSLERACLLLGVDRLRAISLGFHLSRASTAEKTGTISREVWGQSVLRACLAGELARQLAPSLISEAFVIGLMMDAGLPLMKRLAGERFVSLYNERHPPGKLARAELEFLPLTHIDVIVALARSWRLPELLAYPLEWHHTAPADVNRTEPIHRLHRIAYGVGLLDLFQRPPGAGATAPAFPTPASSGVGTLQRVLKIDANDLAGVLDRASKEYTSTIELFAEIAESVQVNDDLIERMHVGLAAAVERVVLDGLSTGGLPDVGARVQVGGQRIEIEPGVDGALIAYLYDSRGQRLLAHSFARGSETAATLSEVLGLELTSRDEIDALSTALQRLAA